MNMRLKSLLPLTCLLFTICLHAQKKDEDYFLMYDSAWNSIKNKSQAYYFIHVHKLNDTAWRHDYYNMAGPRLATETFKDEEGTKPNGRFSWYNAFGYLDSSGYVQDGKKHGKWYTFLPNKYSVKAIAYKEYDHGILLDEKEIEDKPVNDKPGPGEEPAEFNGRFRDFLEKNLQFPDRAMSMSLGNIVAVNFLLDENGNVIDPQVIRSIEYSLDTEAERVINKSSGKWKPGYMNGKPVKSFHEQSINFVLTGD